MAGWNSTFHFSSGGLTSVVVPALAAGLRQHREGGAHQRHATVGARPAEEVVHVGLG
jgi:hypothetical protein